MKFHRVYASPTMIDVEITDLCNEKCRFCFNFDRDSSMGNKSLTFTQVDDLIEKFKKSKIFHVVLSGGETMVKFDLLLYFMDKLKKNGFSTSMNSNLSIKALRKDRLEKLKSVGVDHILVSLPSYKQDVTDYLVNSKGAFQRIIDGIKEATSIGIRVSANMVVQNKNQNDVYLTAKLAAELGCQKIFGTRLVGPDYDMSIDYDNVEDDSTIENVLTKKAALNVLDQLVKAKEDFGINVGTVVSYPLCLLGDLRKYADFVGRGCPTQRGHRISLLPSGEAMACCHLPSETYGNVFKKDLNEIYKDQIKWHDGSYHNPECASCDYRNICESGCRVDAKAYTGKINGRDPLMVGPIIDGKINGKLLRDFRPLNLHYDKEIVRDFDNKKFKVSSVARFRKEDGFYLCSIKYGNVIELENYIAEFLIEHQNNDKSFDLKEFGVKDKHLMVYYFVKDLIVSVDLEFNKLRSHSKIGEGLGFDPMSLPMNDKISLD
jgi:radical SAM protein with 4Fe4S-binding SPASM domain